MTQGAIIFAENNDSVDYVKLAVFAARRIVKYLDIPVSIITDSRGWILQAYPDHPFDQIIDIPYTPITPTTQKKKFRDGGLSSQFLDWKNFNRTQVYDLTPYEKTLVIDSDYILNSDVLKIALESDYDFQIYKQSMDIALGRDVSEFKRINQYSIPFYWATVFVFRKNTLTQAFFDLVTYIKANWIYFKTLYSIDSSVFRNDYAFSIAIHIMNGKTTGDFAIELPGKMSYITDRDILVDADNSKMKFLIEKKNYLGEYLLAKTNGIDVHVMNKMSLSRYIDGGVGV
jgi:hypothetical protein